MFRSNTLRVALVLAAVVLAGTARSMADDREYPKTNLSVSYEVDSAWPQKPAGMKWGHMPGVAVDARDNVYLFTREENPVQVYSADGKFLRTWGKDSLKSAHHIKIDHEGNVWVADIGLHVVQKYTPEGKLLMTLGTRGVAGKDKTKMNMPTDMAITATGEIFVSDGYGNDRIVHFDAKGKYVKEWGQLGHKPGEFSIPHAIAIDAKGRLYVADRNNVRIQVFDQSGKFLAEWRNIVTPWGFCVTKDDEIWVCGSSPMIWRKEDKALGCPPKDQVFMRLSTEGKVLQVWTVPKSTDGAEKPGETNWVHAIAVDSKGNLYVGDIIGKRAQKFVRKEAVEEK